MIIHSASNIPHIPRHKFHSLYSQQSKNPSKKASKSLLTKRLFTPKTHHFHLAYAHSNRSLLHSKNNALRTAKLHISSFLSSPDLQLSNRIQIPIDHHTISHLHTIDSLEISVCYHSPYHDVAGGLRSFECADCLALYAFATQKNLLSPISKLKSKNQMDLFTALKKLKSLKKLVFSFASADGLDIKKISQSILASKVLAKVFLVLRFPFLTNIQANILASCLPSFQRLSRFELDLGNHAASSKTLNAILSNMKGLSRLKEWHFVFEKLSMIPAYLHSFKEAVKNMKSLTALRLNFTSLEFIRTSNEDLGEGLASLKKLKMLKLNMVKCQFPQRSIKSIGSALGMMSSLRKLDINLASSNLERRSVTEFMETMKGLKM